MKINKYPDGSSYVSDTILGKQVFRINSYEDLWHLNQFVDAFLNKHNGIRPNIIIPNLIDAQADRRFNIGSSSGLKLVLKFLNELDANFTIFHPHNAEVVEAMMDNVEIMGNTRFIKDVLLSDYFWGTTKLSNDGGARIKSDNLILMSADAGGFKPLMKLCDTIMWGGETFSASKARTKDGMKQHIGREDFGGKDILIVDDISVYGGTFKGLSKLLRERNCGKLYLAVSHMTIKRLGEDPVTNYFDKVFTTNSKFDEYTFTKEVETGGGSYKAYHETIENLEVIKMF